MSHKQDATIVTFALLFALAGGSTGAVLAQSPAATSLPLPTATQSGSKLRIESSSSMEKINEALKQRYEQQFPDTSINIGYGDSTTAIRAVRQGKADLAAIGRPLTPRETARGLVAVGVTRNKIAIIVGAGNPFTGSLTDQQFAKIFRGEIKDWSEVGGAPGQIRVIDRPETSDTRQVLSSYPVFQGARFDSGATAVKLSEDSTAAVIRELGNDGIGIAMADQVLNEPGVRVIAMHKTTPDDPKYPFSQPLSYVYNKTNTSPALQTFLSYVTAPQFQSAIAQTTPLVPPVTPNPTPTPETVITPDTTAAPPTTPLPDPLADVNSDTQLNGGLLWFWWLWFLGLLGFLVWSWLKNRRSHPDGEPTLNRSISYLIDESASPIAPSLATGSGTAVNRLHQQKLRDQQLDDPKVKGVSEKNKDAISPPRSDRKVNFNPVTFKTDPTAVVPSFTLSDSIPDRSPTTANVEDTPNTTDEPKVVSGLADESVTLAGSQLQTDDTAAQRPVAATIIPDDRNIDSLSNAEPESSPTASNVMQEIASREDDLAASTTELPPVDTISTTSASISEPEITDTIDTELATDSPIASPVATSATPEVIEDTESSPTLPGAIAPGTPLTASGLAVWSEIAGEIDIGRSQPLDESNPEVSDVTPAEINPSLSASSLEVSDQTVAEINPSLRLDESSLEVSDQTVAEISPSQPLEASKPEVSDVTAGEINPSLAQSSLEVSEERVTQINPSLPESSSALVDVTEERSQVLDRTEDIELTGAAIATSGVIAHVQPLEDESEVKQEIPAPADAHEQTPSITTEVIEETAFASVGEPANRETTEVEAAKLDTAIDENMQGAIASEEVLPTAPQGDNSSIVLLCREPEWAYAYWNISNEQKDLYKQQGGAKLALRFYDVTDIDLNTKQPQSIGQYDCNKDSHDGYLEVPMGERDYMVEIGYLADSDRWLMLARSAVVHIPPSAEAQQIANTEFEAVQLLYQPPVSPSILSSSAGKLGATNLLDLDNSDDSSVDVPTSSRPSKLVADVFLTIQGKTEPDATVNIDGRSVKLNSDGSFYCAIPFPDGTSEPTITAVTADGEIYSMRSKFTRETQK